MRVINFEDKVLKHSDISRKMKQFGVTEVAWAKNVEEGLEMIKNADTPYNLVISDMRFPMKPGEGEDLEAGLKLVMYSVFSFLSPK